MKELIALVAVLVAVVGMVIMRAYAPCWTWGMARAADVPARCVMHGR